jgi:hypothetical protein
LREEEEAAQEEVSDNIRSPMVNRDIKRKGKDNQEEDVSRLTIEEDSSREEEAEWDKEAVNNMEEAIMATEEWEIVADSMRQLM